MKLPVTISIAGWWRRRLSRTLLGHRQPILTLVSVFSSPALLVLREQHVVVVPQQLLACAEALPERKCSAHFSHWFWNDDLVDPWLIAIRLQLWTCNVNEMWCNCTEMCQAFEFLCSSKVTKVAIFNFHLLIELICRCHETGNSGGNTLCKPFVHFTNIFLVA